MLFFWCPFKQLARNDFIEMLHLTTCLPLPPRTFCNSQWLVILSELSVRDAMRLKLIDLRINYLLVQWLSELCWQKTMLWGTKLAWGMVATILYEPTHSLSHMFWLSRPRSHGIGGGGEVSLCIIVSFYLYNL